MSNKYFWPSQVLSVIFDTPYEDILNSLLKNGNFNVAGKIMHAKNFYGKEFNAAGQSHNWLGYSGGSNAGYYFKRGTIELVETNSTYKKIYAVLIDVPSFSTITPLYIESNIYDGITVRLDNSQVPVETTRPYAHDLIKMGEINMVSWEDIARASLNYMTDKSVKAMFCTFFSYTPPENLSNS